MKRTLLSMALLAGGSAAWLIGDSVRTEEGAWTEVAGLPVPTGAYKAATIHAHPQAGPIDEVCILVGDGKVIAVLDDASDLPPMLPIVASY